MTTVSTETVPVNTGQTFRLAANDFYPCVPAVRIGETTLGLTESRPAQHEQEGCIVQAYQAGNARLVAKFPGLTQFYGAELVEDGDAYATEVNMPTPAGLQMIYEKCAVGLTPGLRYGVVDTNWEIPIDEYLGLLEAGYFPISGGGEVYAHDVTDHAIGALSISHQSLAIYQTLIADVRRFAEPGNRIRELYQNILGNAIDAYTSLVNIDDFQASAVRKYRGSLLKILMDEIEGESVSEPEAVSIGEHVLQVIGGVEVVEADIAAFVPTMERFAAQMAA